MAASPEPALDVEAQDFRRVLLASKSFDRKLYGFLRKQLRDSGEELIGAVRMEIDRIPSQGKYRRGLRAALKRGTKVSIGTGGKTGRGAGIRIVTGARGYPAAAMNTMQFRHPVFAGKREGSADQDRAWVWQQGHPYFGPTVRRHVPRMRQRVEYALEAARTEMAMEVEH